MRLSVLVLAAAVAFGLVVETLRVLRAIRVQISELAGKKGKEDHPALKTPTESEEEWLG